MNFILTIAKKIVRKLIHLYNIFRGKILRARFIDDFIRTDYTSDAASYYDRYTENYLKSYGDFIQSSVSLDRDALIRELVQDLELKDGMHLLDGGCGVAAPAIALAKEKSVTIDAITISGEQVELAKTALKTAEIKGKVIPYLRDFNELRNYYSPGQFDAIYFFEAMGYHKNMERLIADISFLLKPGGILYLREHLVEFADHFHVVMAQIGIFELVKKEYHYRLVTKKELTRLCTKYHLHLELDTLITGEMNIRNAVQFELDNPEHTSMQLKIASNVPGMVSTKMRFRKSK